MYTSTIGSSHDACTELAVVKMGDRGETMLCSLARRLFTMVACPEAVARLKWNASMVWWY